MWVWEGTGTEESTRVGALEPREVSVLRWVVRAQHREDEGYWSDPAWGQAVAMTNINVRSL